MEMEMRSDQGLIQQAVDLRWSPGVVQRNTAGCAESDAEGKAAS